MPYTPAVILARMRSIDPSSPRLVWHGREGRIELSGRVFDNWVAKSSNLLVDELDATDASVVALDLPVHWKSLALAFACWQLGSVVALQDSGDGSHSPPAARSTADADIILSSRGVEEVEPPRFLVCVALGSLALGWEGPLPRGAVDFAAEVRSHGDVYLGQGGDDADAQLVRAGGRTWTAAELADGVTLPADPAAAGQDVGRARTVLLEPGSDLRRALAAALAVWQEDGALVLVEEGVPVTERMLAAERITARRGTS